MRWAVGKVTAVGAVSVLLAACSAGDGATPSAPADGGQSGESIPLTIAVPPSAFAATLYLGVNEGIFADAGFDVTLTPSTSMAETVPQLLSGDLDYIYADVHNTLIAASENVPLVMTAPITTTASEDPEQKGFANVLTLETSPITSPSDLAGATIGTNSINGQAMLDAIEVLERQGVETDEIEWVGIPGPQLATALRQGQVDAVTLGEPGATATLVEGGVRFVLALDGGLLDTPMAGLTTLADTVALDPGAAERFRDAVIEANERALEDPQLAYDAMAGYMPIPPEILGQSVLPLWATTPFAADSVEPILERLERLNLLSVDRAPDLDAVFPTL
ncbi:ABC transporter substrate-binding protein [Microbacterium sp. LRZ72]|uniref:ABC transporter substrate-binding protein n=1 Tax=Microbacterium sp. LRZ72 TaxID=2942481 RepID=UPI0029B62222|nr:ABC transporter substrate-binding protein [Microbacterium sp. LRZ72]MDX2378041.1 ABC transporter substrate-binding protein [Microbacterium sp. LRZ72]